jgi:hypothetical protein
MAAKSNLEPAIEAAEKVIATSPRKAVYEMAWDLAQAAVKAAYPVLREQIEAEIANPGSEQ